MRSASETFFPPDCSALKPRRILSRALTTFATRAGSFTAQLFCGSRRMRAPLAPPRLSELRKLEAAAQAVKTRSAVDSPDARIFFLSAATSRFPISLWLTFGTGSCHSRSSLGTSGPR